MIVGIVIAVVLLFIYALCNVAKKSDEFEEDGKDGD